MCELGRRMEAVEKKEAKDTHRIPMPKIALSAIFLAVGIWSLHSIGIGNETIITSMLMLIQADARNGTDSSEQ